MMTMIENVIEIKIENEIEISIGIKNVIGIESATSAAYNFLGGPWRQIFLLALACEFAMDVFVA